VLGVAALTAAVVAAAALPFLVKGPRRELPVRPVGWHVQTGTASYGFLMDPRGDGVVRLFPAGRAYFDGAELPLTGAAGELEGPHYQFRLVGSWTMPRLDTREQHDRWGELADAAAPDGSEVLVVSMSWRAPKGADDYRKPQLSAGAVSPVNERTRLTLDVPRGGNRIEMIVRKGSPVHLEVRDARRPSSPPRSCRREPRHRSAGVGGRYPAPRLPP
jgi:hypothetical protein